MSKAVCLRCGFPITWEAQWQQWGRLMRRGLSPEEAKALMPRCQKCITMTIGQKPRDCRVRSEDNEGNDTAVCSTRLLRPSVS
jgi:hypothetical protein